MAPSQYSAAYLTSAVLVEFDVVSISCGVNPAAVAE